jgi:hypothetical protein
MLQHSSRPARGLRAALAVLALSFTSMTVLIVDTAVVGGAGASAGPRHLTSTLVEVL